jgi:hypothetical protein
MVLCITYGKPDTVIVTASYEAGSNPVYAHGLLPASYLAVAMMEGLTAIVFARDCEA